MTKLKPNLTPVSEEEYTMIMEEVMAASESGDEDRYEQALLRIPLSPGMADELKRYGGIKDLIVQGVNLSRAVEAYGEDWLKE
jgi:hypothetical protein